MVCTQIQDLQILESAERKGNTTREIVCTQIQNLQLRTLGKSSRYLTRQVIERENKGSKSLQEPKFRGDKSRQEILVERKNLKIWQASKLPQNRT